MTPDPVAVRDRQRAETYTEHNEYAFVQLKLQLEDAYIQGILMERVRAIEIVKSNHWTAGEHLVQGIESGLSEQEFFGVDLEDTKPLEGS